MPYSLPLTGITFVPYAVAALALMVSGGVAMVAARRRK